ncbi:hypothetical protein SAMN04488527_1152 [Aliiroseovarius crassostreae]|nr:hypothetical protein SAMN04488527_1152 [Aliiroseovarius crassostreae]
MAFLVEYPINESLFPACWISFDMRSCAQIIGDESAQVVGVVGGIHDDVLRVCHPFDQPRRLRAAPPPLSGGDDGSDWQSEGVDRRMGFRGQATFGTANAGSFKPPF